MQRLIKVLLYIWQLPQNILGLFCSLGGERRAWKRDDGVFIFYTKPFFHSGVSLGNYIIVDSIVPTHIDTIKHETGHQKQSLYLGWLYLIIIGLPSFIGNIYSRIKHKDNEWYYNQPWEHWADKLGGVERCSTVTK